jgi:menaquinone-dependent protoporphyrinogen IX oxidase
MGKWTREPQKFLSKNEKTLSGKPVALFVSCGSVEKPEECEKARTDYLDKIEGKYSGLKVVAKGLFGGRYDPNGGFMMRMAMKGVKEEKEKEGVEFDPDAVYDFRDWDAIRAWTLGLIEKA